MGIHSKGAGTGILLEMCGYGPTPRVVAVCCCSTGPSLPHFTQQFLRPMREKKKMADAVTASLVWRYLERSVQPALPYFPACKPWQLFNLTLEAPTHQDAHEHLDTQDPSLCISNVYHYHPLLVLAWHTCHAIIVSFCCPSASTQTNIFPRH